MDQTPDSQEKRLDFLVKALCEDSVQYRGLEVPKTERRRTMRALMNIRMPGPMPKPFYGVQDAFLQQETREKGIVEGKDIPAIGEQYGLTGRFAGQISLWQGDITRLGTDAIVNAANSQLLGCFVPCHGCIDNAIHSAADRRLLRSCYEACLALAEENGLQSIAFCCISTGEFHFPNDEAAKIAVSAVLKHLELSRLERVVFDVLKDLDRKLYEKELRSALR